ncbi:S1 RNA-binding domain-containing protein [Streptomyces sp. NPDC050549]|uniref:S1 RNA-binding domain-containing protein n=1 Tax=Streptomyces sp. NPDC050549 TaxID=3155406 RepID=UPI00343EBE73
MQPDPFAAFAEGVTVGQAQHGQVTEVVPFGVFVRVADGIEGLVRLRELAGMPVETAEGIPQVGDEVDVVVTDIDRARRSVALSPAL